LIDKYHMRAPSLIDYAAGFIAVFSLQMLAFQLIPLLASLLN